jgi:CBS domain containing-hemolysin-like protein
VTAVALAVLAVAALLLTTLAAVGTKVLQELPWHELDEYCRRQRRRDRFDEIHDRHEPAALVAESLQITAAALLTLTIAASLSHLGGAEPPTWRGLAVSLGLVCLVLLFVAVWLPWAIARLWAAPFLFHTWAIWRATSWLLQPLSYGALAIDSVLRRLGGQVDQPSEEEAFEDEIRTIVTEGTRDGLLEADAREMIEGVIELGDRDVADIMTPRSEMDAIPVDLDWSEALRRVIQFGRTRIPVYDKSLDQVVGVLYVKDLLPEFAKPDSARRRRLQDILRRAWFVPKTKHLDDLLQSFLQTRNHMAIVVDEYSAVAGLVTIEDVLEEIVGEIVDEFDKEDLEEIRSIDENTADILGRTHLADINEQLGTDLPEPDDLDTVGGFVVKQLGRIPAAGVTVNWNNLKITVLEASRRRVERVRIERLQNATS